MSDSDQIKDVIALFKKQDHNGVREIVKNLPKAQWETIKPQLKKVILQYAEKISDANRYSYFGLFFTKGCHAEAREILKTISPTSDIWQTRKAKLKEELIRRQLPSNEMEEYARIFEAKSDGTIADELFQPFSKDKKREDVKDPTRPEPSVNDPSDSVLKPPQQYIFPLDNNSGEGRRGGSEPTPLREPEEPISEEPKEDGEPKKKNRNLMEKGRSFFLKAVFEIVLNIIATIITTFLGLSLPVQAFVVTAGVVVVGAATVVTTTINNPPKNTFVDHRATIETANEPDTITISGTVDQRIYIQPLTGPKASDLSMRILDPEQIEVLRSDYSAKAITLQKSGDYILEIKPTANFTGEYSLRIHKIAEDRLSFKIGDRISSKTAEEIGTIELPTDYDVLTFEANEGQHLYAQVLTTIRTSGNSGWFKWQLRDPEGVILSASDFSSFALTIPKTGTYTLTISGTDWYFTGEYAFQIREVVYDELKIEIGQSISSKTAENIGLIELPLDQDIFTFEALEGQNLTLEVLTTNRTSGNSGWFRWQLRDPEGVILVTNNFDTFDVNIQKSGIYTLTVLGTDWYFTGEYAFKITEKTP